MKTPLIAVNDIGDIFFLDEQGNELYAPRGSFEPENLEAFEAIAEACNSHATLTTQLAALTAVLKLADAQVCAIISHTRPTSKYLAALLEVTYGLRDALKPVTP